MYAVYRQAHPPTGLEFSVYCNFISSEEKNLVVAGTSQLYVYRIIHDFEIEVYGSEAQSGTQLATYSFEVCDSILNIGPCVSASMGEPAFLSEEFQSNPEPDLEVVVCSGYGKNGALSVLQRSIRPQVVTTFELPGCHDMWTVVSSEEKPEKPPAEGEGEDAEEEKQEPTVEDEKNKHGFLILSREDSTMILQTGQEIMELDTSGFATQGPTVYAGNIGENKYIIQVSPMGIRLLEGVTQVHFIPVDLGSPIVQCSVADPYVVIMTAEGVVTMFVLKSDTYMGKSHRLALQKPQLHTQSRVITLSAYRDVSGMFTTENKINFLVKEETMARSQTETETVIQDISHSGWRGWSAVAHAGEDVPQAADVTERPDHHAAAPLGGAALSYQFPIKRHSASPSLLLISTSLVLV
uniref:RSE1/DDB1/CPSF1 second beta-propeller domain-containing protein n=1 Tax=Pygocentrus nattereri TaxID=42514 RepID=A0AAR2JQV9_PYGNA